jgi:hypothetical protein
MLTIFFSGVSLVTMDALPSGAYFIQEYLIGNRLPDIIEARERILHGIRKGIVREQRQSHVPQWSQGDR